MKLVKDLNFPMNIQVEVSDPGELADLEKYCRGYNGIPVPGTPPGPRGIRRRKQKKESGPKPGKKSKRTYAGVEERKARFEKAFKLMDEGKPGEKRMTPEEAYREVWGPGRMSGIVIKKLRKHKSPSDPKTGSDPETPGIQETQEDLGLDQEFRKHQVIQLLEKNGQQTLGSLVINTGIDRDIMRNIITELMDEGKVKEIQHQRACFYELSFPNA